MQKGRRKLVEGTLAVWNTMERCVRAGCSAPLDSFLPGPYKVQRRAPGLYQKLHQNQDDCLPSGEFTKGTNMDKKVPSSVFATGNKASRHANIHWLSLYAMA